MVPMPSSRSIDINVEADWAKAEAMYDILEQAAA
jgi:CMP-N-acetylneuraminic acid synthetase